ncbi:ABC transporter substrate-binding protein [Arthrobacter cryoconiti]|uniref:ABC transporter substrate-binding protein n=1 Tax=Arthrobacter cryoconiti TaxID=748907 RepID=A0ABV8QZA8_9MICC|nr:ABC transporter substrate-binding protein [Arthrobacter cryoconiti]MCC9069232.1 ABC transporter substrate-binding protein [Arthrobacter cryoconiti]
MTTDINRRNLLAAAGLGMGALALAACGGPSTAAPAATASATDWSKVKPASKITFMSSHPGKSADIEAALIKDFQAANPGIEVELVTGGANYEEVAQKFQTSQAGNNVPDVVVASDVWWFRYAIAGTVVPLEALLSAVDDKSAGFNKTLYDDYNYGESHWAVPYARSTPLFYYNKDHFAAAGVPDRAPATWDEFASWAPKIQAANAGKPGYLHAYQYPALAGYAGWTLQNVLWGQGAGWSNKWDMTANSDASVKAMQWVADTIVKDGWAGVSSKDAVADMTAGAISSTISSTGDLVGTLKAASTSGMNIGVGFLPGGAVSASPVCPTGGAGLVIATKTSPERQLAAAKFISFVTNAQSTAKFSAATGYMPVRTDADMTPVLSATPQIQVALDQLKVTRSQDYGRVFLPGADLEMANAAAKIMNEKADVKATLDTLQGKLEEIYTKTVKPKLKS